MKNISFLICFFGLAICQVQAQVIFSENFEASANTMPVGWHQQQATYIPTNQGWFFNTTIGGVLAQYVPAHTHYAFVNDYDHNSSSSYNRDTLYTPIINMTGHSSVFISFDYWYYGGFYSNAGDFEIASIAASGDGGVTWSTIDTMGCWEQSFWRTGLYDLSAYAGNPNVMLAFTYDDLAHQANGFVVDNINVYGPINYDAGVINTNMFYLCKTNNTYSVTGAIHNYGGNTINSMHLKYCVNNGPVQSDFINSISIPPLSNYNFTHSINWTPTSSGDYIIKMWADTLSGTNVDQLHANDTLHAYFVVVDTLQNKIPVVEEFTQASCDPCMHATPNMDSVLFNNQTTSNGLRYHVNYPGVDHMNDVTQIADVEPRRIYYGVTGVPDAIIDGVTDVYPGFISTIDLQAARAPGSPFTITVNSSYNALNHQYTATAYITAHGDLPAGLTARAVLTVDTMKYLNDQSIEDPPSVFAPPIGTGTVPDYYYPYTLNYSQVVEHIMPDANGTSLGAFTNGQTQVINFSWIKDHPWGSNRNIWLYDSINTHITVFVQNDSNLQAGWGAPKKYIYQSGSDAIITTGIVENQMQANTLVFPNPFSTQTTIEILSSTKIEHAELKVFDLLGQEVSHQMFGDDQKVMLSSDKMESGIYFYQVVQKNKVIATGKMLVE